ncbi:MAG: 50S ribosomal protein L22 [Armatimonadota bacterium]|nr:50S ribosomal protein L22 [Armatimonadota bacterium]
MNTASRDRALLHTVTDYFKDAEKGRRTPISKLALSKERDGSLKVALHTSRPNLVRMESDSLAQALKDQIGVSRPLTVQVVPEARAVAKFVRTSPRKARLVIDVIKGKRVSEAIAMLRFIPNHAAELISKVLISAAANAQDGWGAGVEELKVVNILADGGPTLKRVRPRAQGRAFRILKRTSHLTVILTEEPAPVRRAASAAKPKPAKAPVPPKAEPAVSAAPVEEVVEPTITDVTPVAQVETAEPQEATPVTASDAPESGTDDKETPLNEPDTADQKRSEGE